MANDIKLGLKITSDISEAKKGIEELQQSLAKIKFADPNETNSLNKLLDKIINSYNNVIRLNEQSSKTPSIFKRVAEEGTQLRKLLGQLPGALQKLDLDNINVDSAQIRDLRKQLAGINTEIKQISSSIDNSNITNLIDTLKKSGSKAGASLFEAWDGGNGDINAVSNILDSLDPARFKTNGSVIVELQNAVAAYRQELTTLSPQLQQCYTKQAQLNQQLEEAIQQEKELATSDLQSAADNAEAFRDSQAEALDVIDQTNQRLAQQGTLVDTLTQKVTQLGSVLTLFRTIRTIIDDAYESVKSLDEVMTEMAVVTDKDVGDYWKELGTYTERANELGASIQDVYESMTLYYQQGLTNTQATALSNATLKMARIAGLDAEDATERMTNALRGFNKELTETEANNVADVYSALAAKSAANVDQISTAMTKVASLANSANMELESTAAFLTQIIETTQESPETAGTALKTIIARFSEVKELVDKGETSGTDSEGEEIDVNNISKALRTVGIDLNEYIQGNVGLDEIFLQLSEQWNTLDFDVQKYIATQAAGSRQQSRFIAMMSDYDRTLELVDIATNSAGASNEQFEKTLDSLESKLNTLSNQWTTFTTRIADASIIKTVIDAGSNLLNIINKIGDALGTPGLFNVSLLTTGFVAAFKACGKITVVLQKNRNLINDQLLVNRKIAASDKEGLAAQKTAALNIEKQLSLRQKIGILQSTDKQNLAAITDIEQLRLTYLAQGEVLQGDYLAAGMLASKYQTSQAVAAQMQAVANQNNLTIRQKAVFYEEYIKLLSNEQLKDKAEELALERAKAINAADIVKIRLAEWLYSKGILTVDQKDAAVLAAKNEALSVYITKLITAKTILMGVAVVAAAAAVGIAAYGSSLSAAENRLERQEKKLEETESELTSINDELEEAKDSLQELEESNGMNAVSDAQVQQLRETIANLNIAKEAMEKSAKIAQEASDKSRDRLLKLWKIYANFAALSFMTTNPGMSYEQAYEEVSKYSADEEYEKIWSSASSDYKKAHSTEFKQWLKSAWQSGEYNFGDLATLYDSSLDLSTILENAKRGQSEILEILGVKYGSEEYKRIITQLESQIVDDSNSADTASKADIDDLDKYYNKVEKLAELENQLAQTQEEYNRLLKDTNATVEDITANRLKQVQILKDEKAATQDLLNARKTEISTLVKNSVYKNYAGYSNGSTWIDYNKISKAGFSEDEYDEFKEYLDKLEELDDEIDEYTQDLVKIDNDISEQIEDAYEDYISFEEQVYDAIIEQQQQMIDNQQDELDALDEANQDLLDSINTYIDDERKQRDRDESKNDLESQYRRLAYLKQDTSGVNDLAIKQLEEEINNAEQDYTDTLIDDKISELEDQNDIAIEQRQKQIDLQQELVDFNTKNGTYKQQAEDAIREASADGESLLKLFTSTEDYQNLSSIGKDEWKIDFFEQFKAAMSALGLIKSETTTTTPTPEGAATPTNTEGSSEKTEAQWSRVLEAYNKINTGAWGRGVSNRIQNGADDGFTEEEIREAQRLINLRYGGSSWADAKKALGYKTGGLADYTGPAWVDGSYSQPELVLNAKDTENFIQLKDILAKGMSEGTMAIGGDAYYSFSIQVDQLASDYDVDQVVNRIQKRIAESSKYRNVNAISLIK